MSKEITSKTKRLAEILALLKQGPASVPELAAGFGVSVRTVQRDMGACSDAKFPVVSPKQSVYSFAEGFSLDAVQLSCEEAALLVVSAAIAKQIGGSFGAAQQQVARRFSPPALPRGRFAAVTDFSETDSLVQTLFQCIREHWVIRVSLKDSLKNCTLYPYQLLLLENKYWVLSVTPKGEIHHYALENIKSFSLRSGNGANFLPIPFAEWAVWQYVCRLIDGLQTRHANPAVQTAAEPPAPEKASTTPVLAAALAVSPLPKTNPADPAGDSQLLQAVNPGLPLTEEATPAGESLSSPSHGAETAVPAEEISSPTAVPKSTSAAPAPTNLPVETLTFEKDI